MKMFSRLVPMLVVLAATGCSITYERSGSFDGESSSGASWWLITARQGDMYARAGRYRSALEYYDQAKRQAEADADIQGIALTRGLIADIYSRLGQYERSLESSMEALLIFERIGDAANGGRILTNMAAMLSALERRDEAVEALELAYPLLEQSGELRLMGGAFFATIAATLAGADRLDEALEFYDKALEFPALSTADRAGVLFAKGNVRFEQERYDEALDLYEQSRDAAQAFPMVLFGPLLGIGSVYEQRGQLITALDYYEQSIELQEDLLRGASAQQFIMSMAEPQMVGYRRAIPVAIKLGRTKRAFELSEAAKSRAFLHQLVSTNSGREGFATSQRADSLRLHLAELTRELEISEAAAEVDREEVNRLKGQIASLRQSLETATRDLGGSYVLFDSVEPAGVAELAEIQESLGEDMTLVSYFVAGENVIAFVIGRDSFDAIVLPTSEVELESVIQAFDDFSVSSARNLAAASAGAFSGENAIETSRLGTLLIAPIRQQLTTSRVGIIPSGLLHYVSFAAIKYANEFFGDMYTLFYLPSASTISHLVGRTSDSDLMLAVSRENVDDLPPLEFADVEVRKVAELYDAEPLVGNSATETAVRSGVGDATILHLAAHGELNPVKPMFSRIMLGPDDEHDGSLEVHEIHDLDLSNIDLVVLSACDTQLGPLSKGDDFVGLSRAFLSAGASTVIASLWPVNDEATAILMTGFYRNLRAGMGKATALADAQKTIRETFPHPYYWAGFVLSGDPGSQVPISNNAFEGERSDAWDLRQSAL